MTQTEYEQKKRECWEEFLSFDNRLTTTYEQDIAKEALFFAFDRAYALGREKETITQEEICKAATHYACMGHPGYDPAIRKAYIEGANFVLNS